MPDISMCNNNVCPKRYNCFRYMAQPSQRQVFSKFEFETNNSTGHTTCDGFVKILKGDKLVEPTWLDDEFKINPFELPKSTTE